MILSIALAYLISFLHAQMARPSHKGRCQARCLLEHTTRMRSVSPNNTVYHRRQSKRVTRNIRRGSSHVSSRLTGRLVRHPRQNPQSVATAFYPIPERLARSCVKSKKIDFTKEKTREAWLRCLRPREISREAAGKGWTGKKMV